MKRRKMAVGGGLKAALISPACLSFCVPLGWVRLVIVTLDLCVCVCV